ncbi:MAG: hypothetical protein A0129_14895 [Limnobacter sp. CACIAM 66H1]|uniref:restriction endonuclease subunit S n=1 Tax=Limnobacter sp. CACIAM 66H1 TaxID=1813033 RepID=UPI0007A8E644|nr:restriction endonuclease subunit S [Limnobacter sp. CACIAM 66H1]KYP10070.1 MAG: hypothetical protein A0129_14895 [Limnobacter sp. CACIAM 66H1]
MSVVLSEHLPLLASASDGIQKLRGLILELAVRGKLVPQDPADEPASKLLEQIAQEKARLETEGTCKKSKVKPTVSENERPFHLPDNWRWVRLGHFCLLEMGQSPSSEHYNQLGDGIPFFQGKADFGAKYPTARYWCTEPTKYADNGDVLLSVRAPVGPTNVAQYRCCIGRGLAALRPLGGVPTEYLLLVVQARRTALEMLATGTTFVAVSKSDIEPFLVPVPPLAEQHRIVAKVAELMALCDRLEAEQADAASAHARLVETLLGTLIQNTNASDFATNWQRLAEHFNTLFATEASIEVLKQTILQLAVMGKLVPQDPNDEPASELLKQIKQERARLEAEGVFKQSKPLPPVGEKEQPFVLPDGWEWVKVGSIAVIRGGKRLPAGHNYSPVPTEHIYIQVTNMKNGTILRDDLKYIDEVTYAEIARYTISTDDLYVTIAGTIGQVGCVPQSFDGMNLTENAAKLSFSHLDRLGLRMILSSPYVKIQFLDKANQQAQPKLALRNIADTVIALPPKDEQQRIVAKVDELMALCDHLKADLVTAQQMQAALADTLIESALEAAW